MTIYIEDTVRNNLASWCLEAVGRGVATGAIINPFASPTAANGYKQSARTTVDRLVAGSAEVWFDPLTHALQMPAVGDFRYYDEWDLWGGNRGDLETEASRQDHVRRVFAIQDDLEVPHLAPTILLHTPESTTSERALEMAEYAVSLDPACRLTVAGDAAFWAAGNALDAHVGALAQLEPGGWSLVCARPYSLLPVPADENEVYGVCRTTFALQEYAPVHISHGDLAGLPAAAAGATSLGSGWDPRQRVCAYASFSARDADGEGGQWFQQVTFQGLLSLTANREAELLFQRDPALAQALLYGATVPPGPKEKFLHHAEVLTAVSLALSIGGQAAYDALNQLYTNAERDWARGCCSRHG